MDIVYLWVDGSHPKCRAYRGEARTPYQVTNHDELKFSLLSVHRHASWARRIVVVSECGVRPVWADTFPRVEWLDQDRILPPHARPARNNMVLEAYLHRIPNISEPFLYFNDDYFLGQPVTPDMWLKPRWTFFRGNRRITTKKSPDRQWLNMTVRTADVCRQRWGTAQPFYLQHTPYLVSGPAMEAVLGECSREIDQMVRRHSGRHSDDVVVLLLMQEWLLKHHPHKCTIQTLRRQGTPSYYFANVGPNNYAQALQQALAQPYHLLTLNDNFANAPHVARALRATLHALNPAVRLLDLATGAVLCSDIDIHGALDQAARQNSPTLMVWGPQAVSAAQGRAWRAALPASIAWDVVLLPTGTRLRMSKASAQMPDAVACALRPKAASYLHSMKHDPRQLPSPGAAHLGVYAANSFNRVGNRQIFQSPGFGLAM